MTTSLERRDFLKHGAAAVILGFPFLDRLARADKPESKFHEPPKGELPRPPQGNFWALARERMGKEIKPAVVIVIPEDREKAGQLTYSLGNLIGATDAGLAMVKNDAPGGFKGFIPDHSSTGDDAAQILFCQAVFVCLTSEEFKQAFPGFQTDGTLILTDLNGKPLDSLKADPELFGKEFAAHLRKFLHGDKGQHLQAVVDAQRKALGEATFEQLDAAIRDLDSNRFAIREAASKRLAELAPRATGPLAAAMEAKPPLEVKYRIVKLFREIYAAAEQLQPSPRLPYGVQWEVRHFEACPGCGRTVMAPRSRLFLGFIAHVPKDKK